MYRGGLEGVANRKDSHSYIFLGHWLNGEGDFCTKYLIYLFS